MAATALKPSASAPSSVITNSILPKGLSFSRPEGPQLVRVGSPQQSSGFIEGNKVQREGAAFGAS